MRPINAVLAHREPGTAQHLTASLNKEFRNLLIAKSAFELRSTVARFRAPFAIVDLELIGLSELKELCREFPATAFVAVHRLADDKMWAEALAMGAVDCCQSDDLRGILMAAQRYVVLSRAKGAAAA
jgi:DNA-binding NarL/FixJ family response regulator